MNDTEAGVAVRMRRFAVAVRHTRPNQLAHRLLLTLRRAVRDRLPQSAGPLVAEPRPTRRHADVPVAPLPLREQLVEDRNGDAFVILQGLREAVRLPIDWSQLDTLAPTALGRLNLHYTEFVEALDAEGFARCASAWIHAFPPTQPGAWRSAWNSYALSLRTLVWMQQIERHSDALAPAAEEELTRSLVAQLRYLRRNLELDLGGNHLLKNLTALLWASRWFEGSEATGWGRLALRILCEQLDEQILADGVHFERSPAYHCQVLCDLVHCMVAAPAGEQRDQVQDAVERMAQALAKLTHTDGLVSLFGDGGLRMSYSPAQCLEACRAVGATTPDLTRPRDNATSLVNLSTAGYYGRRTSRDLVLFDCGPIAPDHLAAHGHGDALAFEWSVDGRRIVVDAGVFGYEPGAARRWSRSTRAHNTVTVADADQCEFFGSFRMARRARVRCSSFEPRDDGFRLVGSHDGYAHLHGRPIHERTADVSGERIEVSDRVRGGAGQPVRARILLHPEVAVRRETECWILERSGTRIALRTAALVEAVTAPWSPDFDVELTTRQLVLDYGEAPCEGGFSLEIQQRDSDPGRTTPEL